MLVAHKEAKLLFIDPGWWKMELKNYRIGLITIGLIGILLFTLPSIAFFVSPNSGQEFSVLYVTGTDHTLESIPFDVQANSTYSICLGVTNYLRSSAYYTCFVKLLNETDPLPKVGLETASPVPSIYQYYIFVESGKTMEEPLTFKVNDIFFSNNVTMLKSITINGHDFIINKTSSWDLQKSGYYYEFLIELWIFNAHDQAFQFNNRFVQFSLNLTET